MDQAGDLVEAEKQWRAALALDATSYEANVGVASAVLRRDATSAELADVNERLAAAGVTWREAGAARDAKREAELTIDAAVYVALIGNVKSADGFARRVLKDDPSNEAAKEILAAIGR